MAGSDLVSSSIHDPHKCPSHRDGVLWGDSAVSGAARDFHSAGLAPAADVTPSAATGTKGCNQTGLPLARMKYNETSSFDASSPPFAGVAPGIRRLESIAVFSCYFIELANGPDA